MIFSLFSLKVLSLSGIRKIHLTGGLSSAATKARITQAFPKNR